MTENECKHEGAGTAKFCPQCGKQLRDESMERFSSIIRQTVEDALDARGIKKPEKKDDKKDDKDKGPSNEFERLTGKK